IGLHAGTEFLILALGDLETVLDVIDGGGGELLGAIAHAMMVGENQAIRAHDRGGATGRKPRRGATHAVEPGLVELQAIFLVDGLKRKIVEGPHAFIGMGRALQKNKKKSRGRKDRAGHGAPKSFWAPPVDRNLTLFSTPCPGMKSARHPGM